jgi:hypothetical protein
MRNDAAGGAVVTYAKLLTGRTLEQEVNARETGSLRIWMRAIARMTDWRSRVARRRPPPAVAGELRVNCGRTECRLRNGQGQLSVIGNQWSDPGRGS